MQLTQAELELMMIIWQLGQASVKDVIGHLPEGRNLAYTSVSTIMRILEKKQVLSSEKIGRGHLYRPKLTKAEYEKASVQHLTQTVFTGRPISLVKCLIENDGLSENEISQLRKLLESDS